MKVKKYFAMWLILTVVFLALLPISMPQAHAAGQTIYFGIDKDFPPYSWKDKDGNVKGFYVDIYNYIKEQLEKKGYHVESVVDEGPTIMNLFREDRIQVLMGLSITPERKKLYYFTTPLHILTYRMYTIKHKYIKSIEDLKNPVSPLTVGVLKDSTAEAYVKENFPSLFIKEYPSVEEAIKALIDDKIDLLMGYEYIVKFYLQNSFPDKAETVYMLPIDFPGGHKWHAIAINKNHQDLAYEIDEIIKEMSEKGILAEIDNKWFGSSETMIAREKLVYYIIFAILGIIVVAFAYHIQLSSATRKLKALVKEKEDQKSQMEYQMNELVAAREELTAMSEQLMAQQEELTYLYENERTLKTQLEKQNDFLSTLLAFFRVPEEGSDFTSQLKSFLIKTKDTFDASGVYLYKYVPEKDILSLIAYTGSPKPSANISPGLVQSFLLGKTTFLPASADPLGQVLGVEDGFILVVPLVALKESKGVLILYFDKEIPDADKNNVVSILENLAPSLAIYMENMMVIEIHLEEMIKLRELVGFIEKVISFTDVELLLKEFLSFAKHLVNMDGAILTDSEGNIIYSTSENIQVIVEIAKKFFEKDDILFFDDEKKINLFILPMDIREKKHKLIVYSHSPELSPESVKSNTYFLKLVSRFVSIYASNILYAKKLEELLKMRAKESNLLRNIVNYLLQSPAQDNANLVIVLAEIMEKSGIPVKVIRDGNIIYGKEEIPEKQTINISYQGRQYTIIIGDELPDYLKSTIGMWITMKEEHATWARKLEASRAQWLGIIDSSPYPLVAIDESGKINKVNKAFSILVGKDIDELLGQDIETIIPGIIKACEGESWQDWHCYEWVVDDIPIGKILIKGEV